MKEKEFLPLVESRLGIESLNPMQKEMLAAATRPGDVLLLSPTGSGKTLAFLLYMLKLLRPSSGKLQAVVICPTRELASQTAETARRLAPGYRTVLLCGGHNAGDEAASLAAGADVVVATPGRLLDHSRRHNLELLPASILIIDEFDKCLELGFSKEMEALMKRFRNLGHTLLTSATDLRDLPPYIRLTSPARFDRLRGADAASLRQRLKVRRIDADVRDKLATLERLLRTAMPTGTERTIVFVNHREAAERVADALRRRKANPGLYTGALEQHDREIALALFNNGTRPLLVATDLAARGLDIADVRTVIHYHQPVNAEAFTHRNGRTARVDNPGDAYVIIGPDEDVADFITFSDTYFLSADDGADGRLIPSSGVATLYIGAGRRDKISRGDVLGFLIKEGGLEGPAVGRIVISDRYALAAIPAEGAAELAALLSTRKIKGTRRKVSPIF